MKKADVYIGTGKLAGKGVYAARDFKKGEMITINATKEIQYELESFVAAHEKTSNISDFKWIKGGYRNAVVRYSLKNEKRKQLTLKRIDGNWFVLTEHVEK